MKKVIFILILVMFCEFSFSQSITSIKVYYNKHIKSLQDKTDSNPKQLRDLLYILEANSTESTFNHIKTLDMDNFSNKRFIGRSGGNGIYYKNLDTKEKLHQKDYGGKQFLISYHFNRFEWKIDKVSKVIGNYKCYKATTSYSFYSKLANETFVVNIVAWFTPEISLPFGPAGYDGLPGLVLEAQIGGFYFVASKIELNSNVKIIKPTNGKKVSHEEYEDIVQKATDNKDD